MIRVVITGPPNQGGWLPYRVDWFAKGRPQLVGVSPTPLHAACRQLRQMGVMDSTVVALFDEKGLHAREWRARTTVGVGSRFEFRPHEGETPDYVVIDRADYEQIKKDFDFTDEEAAEWRKGNLTYERPTKRAEEQPKFHRLLANQDDKGSGPIKRGTLSRKRQKRRRAKSGGRSAQR